jgi:hypothetical protein
MGASNYRSIGCDRNIYFDFIHSPRIYDSISLHSLPLFSNNLFIIVSTSTYSFCILEKTIIFKYYLTDFIYYHFYLIPHINIRDLIRNFTMVVTL